MRLLIDIGNTNISISLYKGKKRIKSFFIHSFKREISRASVKRLLGRFTVQISSVTIVSVVPELEKILKKSLSSILKQAVIKIVGKDIKVPIKNKYRPQKNVGQDRLVCAYASRELYGGEVVVMDFGTALTFDHIDRNGGYEGGLIFPGIRLSLDSLFDNTALLPYTKIDKPLGFVGKSTYSSINNGVIYGYASLCDGIIDKFISKFGKNIKFIATGGDASLIARQMKMKVKVVDDLIFKGMLILCDDI